ncbi:hypothetical protein EYC80_001911 [Monilinia laxa]|uniref:Uncharacterized protein n=1 Tax=Monilinia laxa TaxID=61186 RepID=A0A5N6K6L0_MONLA|nr:hypothetical protein EYC80_001911 [Monilinia laxa]
MHIRDASRPGSHEGMRFRYIIERIGKQEKYSVGCISLGVWGEMVWICIYLSLQYNIFFPLHLTTEGHHLQDERNNRNQKC